MPGIIGPIAQIIMSALTAAGVEVVTAAWIALVVATTAVFGGLYAYNRQQLARANRRLGADNGQTLTVRQPAAARVIIYGQTRVGGVMVFAATSGTKNEYLNMVVAHAGHQCNDITRFWVNNDELTLDGSGNVTGCTDQNGTSTSKYNGFIIVKKHLGTSSQTYDTDLAGQVAAWDSTHRLRGICYTYWQFKYDSKVFTGGLPNVSVMVQGKLVYDPRSTTTAYSANAALCLRDYLLDVDLGLGAASTEVDDTAASTAANVCDEAVTLKAGGTESRYTINGVIDTSTQCGGVIQDMMGAMAGICPYIGGKFRMLAGSYNSPVLSLSEADLRGPVTVSTRESRRTAFNSIKGVYIADVNNWQPGDFAPIQNSTYVTEDNGDVIWRDIQLPLTNSGPMAQRLANIELLRSRQDKVVTFPAKLTALNCQVGDNISLTLSRYGFSSKVFEVTGWQFSVYDADGGQALGIDLQLRETASSVWSWNAATQEGTTLQTALPALYNPQGVSAPSGLTLGSANLILADGTTQQRLQVSWTAPADQFILSGGFVHVEFKKTSDTPWRQWDIVRGDLISDYITDVVAGVPYDVQIYFENVQGFKSAVSSASYTMPAAANYTGSAPSLSPPGQLFTTSIVITPTVPSGYYLRYTTTGVPVTSSSPEWPGGFGAYSTLTLTTTTPLRAALFDSNGNRSQEAINTYTLNTTTSQVAMPYISKSTAPGYSGTVTLTCATSGATIKYRDNGGAWTTYSTPVSLAAGHYFETYALKATFTDSDINYYENVNPNL